MHIIRGSLHLNPPLTRIQISFFHIRQYLYPYRYPYPKVKCGYGYGKDNIRSASDSISEGSVLDNDIGMEEIILQWNKTLDFDILSW